MNLLSATEVEDRHENDRQVWDFSFRYLDDLKPVPDYKRGILRQSQQYDANVNAALKVFDPELQDSIKGWTRAPGREADVFASLKKYDKRAIQTCSPLHADNRFRTAYNLAVTEASHAFRLPQQVVPRWVLDVDLVPNTSSGFPHFKKKSEIYDQIRQEGRFHFHHLKRLPLWRCPLLPCVPATRGGLAEVTEPKTRLVWMYPGAMTACEAVFAQPLIDAIYDQKRHLLMTGHDATNKLANFAGLIDGDEGFFGVGLDFKSFDTLPFVGIIRDAFFKVLEPNIHHGAYYDKTNGVDQGGKGVTARSKTAFKNIVEYFINTPLLLPNGRVVQKHHGIPSGSHFTNLIDSIVNRILINTFAYYNNIKISALMTNGDDSAFRVSETYIKDILKHANEFFDKFFRMTVSVTKSCVAALGSEMHASGTRWKSQSPYRPTIEWMKLAMCPSSFVRDHLDTFQRLLGLGIAGAFRDQYFCRFFDFFQTGFDCKKGPNLLDWTKLRWLTHAFGVTDLPLVYKQRFLSRMRFGILVA
uniref:RNA-dependent RNA polymerase n=1 Tax=Tongren Parti tick virus 1 TaxID=2972271 RepID=A0A9E8A9J4_9VIRU|nr:MAG: RNA-dependent RNA polymerase [Tongren Parti tick virus 1]